MQAIVLDDFGSVDNFSLRALPLPAVKEGHLLIRIKATSFNPIDYQIRQGLGERKLLHSPVLGREFAGEVVGGDYTQFGFAEGEAVYGYAGSLGSNGTYAEYISVPAAVLAKKPVTLPYEEAATIPMAGLTALQCVDRLQVPKEASVFIAGGAGGVGGFLIKLLRASGVQRIFTSAGNENSRQALIALGLSDAHILNYREPDFAQQALTQNGGAFSFCIDLVGGAMSDICAGLLAIHGTYADVTFLGTPASREVLFDKGATIYNISNYALAMQKTPEKLALYGKNLGRLTAFLEAGALAAPPVLVVGPLSVETVQQAHTLLETNQSQGRKLVMQMP